MKRKKEKNEKKKPNKTATSKREYGDPGPEITTPCNKYNLNDSTALKCL